MKFTPVVLSGGSGSRLWPSSRSLHPKQFLRLISEQSMLQETIIRITNHKDAGEPIIVCNNAHRFFVAEQLREIETNALSIILEPLAKNTAPAITLAALKTQILSPEDDIMLILPADHVIQDEIAFFHGIDKAIKYCSKGKLVSFSIIPDKPETGYGYIKSGEMISDGVFSIEKFVEKPNSNNAKLFIESGEYSWNSGMFMFRARDYLEEIKKNNPGILKQCSLALHNAKEDMDFTRIDKESFSECQSTSIDYAVMEKTSKGIVIPIEIGWNDIGSWPALWEIKDKDKNGNSLDGDIIVKDVNNSLIQSNQKLVTVIGLNDIVLVETDDAILLTSKDRAQEVKGIVSKLKSEKRPEAQLHRKVYRPWGYYDSIENGDGFQVKRLVVIPGGQLSLQMHHHRAEHWVVVKGTAEVVNGDQKVLLRVNESTYIPIGERHQLANPGKINLELIEVQSGSYLDEDDIVRFQDVYGRVKT